MDPSCHPEPFIHCKVHVVSMSNSVYEDGSVDQSEDGSVVGEDDAVDNATSIIANVPHHPSQPHAAEASQGGRAFVKQLGMEQVLVNMDKEVADGDLTGLLQERGGRQASHFNYSVSEVEHMLDYIHEILLITGAEWDLVAA